jgi:hypothetical protein
VVQSVAENFIFTICPLAHVSLFYSCFSKNIINDKYFFSILGYGTLRELYEGALQPR